MFQAKWPSPVCPLLSPNATKRRFKASTFVVYVLFIIFFIIAELLDMARWDLGDWCPSNVINRIYQKNSKLSEQTIIVINCPSFTLFLSFFFVCSKLYKFNSLLTSFRDIWSSSAMRGCVYRLSSYKSVTIFAFLNLSSLNLSSSNTRFLCNQKLWHSAFHFRHQFRVPKFFL